MQFVEVAHVGVGVGFLVLEECLEVVVDFLVEELWSGKGRQLYGERSVVRKHDRVSSRFGRSARWEKAVSFLQDHRLYR